MADPMEEKMTELQEKTAALANHTGVNGNNKAFSLMEPVLEPMSSSLDPIERGAVVEAYKKLTSEETLLPLPPHNRHLSYMLLLRNTFKWRSAAAAGFAALRALKRFF